MSKNIYRGWCYACGRDVAVRGSKIVRHTRIPFQGKPTPCDASGKPVRARHNVDIATR